MRVFIVCHFYCFGNTDYNVSVIVSSSRKSGEVARSRNDGIIKTKIPAQRFFEVLYLCSLALNHVECVMDQDKIKPQSPPPSAPKSSTKSQQRHHEHNYTNPRVDEEVMPKDEKPNDSSSCESGDGQKVKLSNFKSGSSSQYKMDIGQRQAIQPSSTVASERSSLEVKNKVTKKDVFNRIRRSEEELQKAAEMVRGGMTFQTASDTFNIPISTIRFYMARRGILPQRRRGRGSSGVRDDDLIHPPFEIIHYRLPDIDKPV